MSATGYDSVRRYARGWLREQSAVTADAYVPLSFAPGKAYQFDWSHEIVVINGATTQVKVAHVRLCHSRMLFVRAYPRESQEMVFDAHDRAFAFFKGACTRGIYDNMKTAVETIFVGKERAYNRRFQQMCSHYLVDPVACTPASGWEKGQVENQVGLVRERFFAPRLRVKNYDELNAWLMDQVLRYAKAHRHPEQRDRTIWEMISTEFEPSKVAQARKHLDAGGLADLIEIREGDALKTLAADLPEQVDLLLLDGAKPLYPDILDLVEGRLRAGSLIVADNADDSPDYLQRVRAPGSGYLSVPLAEDVELSMRLG